jgi:probable HAF family extracellular repeat protein
MKSTNLMCFALVALFTVALVTPLAAQQQAAKHHNYKVIDVGTLGGPTSGFNGDSRIINRKGVAVGGADTSVFDPNCGCYVSHGFRWEDGVLTDLGPLPGGANTFAIAINSPGSVAGISENGLTDPVTGAPAFVATIWKNGQIINLGTFGGSFSLPNDINSRGDAAGGAENTIPDPFDFGGNTLGLPSPTQWHATLWQHGTLRDLGTLGDGLDSFALFVNEPGQAAGFSFIDSIVNPETVIPTVDPFFWENGQMVDLGTLGGVFGTVSGLNNMGQVIGVSDLAGDLTQHPFSWYRGVLTDIGTFGGDNGSATWVSDNGEVVGGADLPGSQTHRAYLWKNGVMQDLGTVGTGPCSRADSINESGQIVGESTHFCGSHKSVAFLWENGGPMIDLNSFVPPGSGIVLNDAAFINEQGEIAVDGHLNGDHHAFILVPVGDCDDACESRIAANQNNAMSIQSSATQKQGSDSPVNRASEFRNRLMQRYHSLGTRP